MLSTRRKPVAEGATRRTLHERLHPVETDVVSADGRNIEIGCADQQRAELGFVQGAEEFGETAARDVDIERLLIVALDREFDLTARDVAKDLLNGRPFVPRAAFDALGDRG